jgi:hypothetical protein
VQLAIDNVTRPAEAKVAVVKGSSFHIKHLIINLLKCFLNEKQYTLNQSSVKVQFKRPKNYLYDLKDIKLSKIAFN